MMPLKNTQMYMIGLKENKQIFDTVYWAPGTYERFMAILRDLTNSHPAHKPAVHIAERPKSLRMKDCLAFGFQLSAVDANAEQL